jgi:hypothetical protein
MSTHSRPSPPTQKARLYPVGERRMRKRMLMNRPKQTMPVSALDTISKPSHQAYVRVLCTLQYIEHGGAAQHNQV